MFEGQISESLRLRLAGKVRGIPVGAGKLHGKKTGERGLNALRPQLPATQGEVGSGIRLVWDNPHMTKATGRNTSRAALVICE